MIKHLQYEEYQSKVKVRHLLSSTCWFVLFQRDEWMSKIQHINLIVAVLFQFRSSRMNTWRTSISILLWRTRFTRRGNSLMTSEFYCVPPFGRKANGRNWSSSHVCIPVSSERWIITERELWLTQQRFHPQKGFKHFLSFDILWPLGFRFFTTVDK